VDKWKVYLVIVAIPLLGGSAASLLRVIIAFTLRDLGISVFEIGLLSSAFMLSRAIFSPILGHLADRGFKRHILISLGFMGLLVDSQLYLHMPYTGVLILRTLDGIFGAMVWPTMQAMVHFSSPKDLRARIMSLYFVMGSVGMSLGYLLYSYIIGNISYALILIATIYLIEFGLGFGFREGKTQKKTVKRHGIEKRPEIALMSITFLFGMYMSLGNEVLLFYLSEILNLGRILSTMTIFLSGIVALIGSIFLGHIADKKSFHASLFLLGIIAPLSALMIAVNYVPVAIAGTVLFFIAGRGFMPISRSFTASTSKEIGASLGFINLASNMGSMIGPLVGGYAMDMTGNEKLGFVNLSAVTFIVVGTSIFLVSLLMMRKYQEDVHS